MLDFCPLCLPQYVTCKSISIITNTLIMACALLFSHGFSIMCFFVLFGFEFLLMSSVLSLRLNTFMLSLFCKSIYLPFSIPPPRLNFFVHVEELLLLSLFLFFLMGLTQSFYLNIVTFSSSFFVKSFRNTFVFLQLVAVILLHERSFRKHSDSFNCLGCNY
jgi:hypothetical protein